MRGLGHGVLVLPVAGDPVLCTDLRPYRKDLVAVDDVRQSNDLVELVAGALREKGLATARLGLAGWDILPLAFYRDLTTLLPDLVLEPADALLNRLRRIKSEAEIGLLRRAARIAGAGLEGALRAVRPGVTEAEVCARGLAAVRFGPDNPDGRKAGTHRLRRTVRRPVIHADDFPASSDGIVIKVFNAADGEVSSIKRDDDN